MAKSYSGLDKTEAFFAHYGRKGMKRGMNIYNPDYKPVGEKAKGTSDGKIAQRSISAKPTTYKSAMSGDPRYSNSPKISVTGVQSSAKDGEREAMNAAAGRATIEGSKQRLIEKSLGGPMTIDDENAVKQLLSDDYKPSDELIEKTNTAFKKLIDATNSGESTILTELLKDDGKKALAAKLMLMMQTGRKVKDNKTYVKKDETSATARLAPNSEQEAMNRASSAATKSGAKSAREKLLEAERKRQANIYRR